MLYILQKYVYFVICIYFSGVRRNFLAQRNWITKDRKNLYSNLFTDFTKILIFVFRIYFINIKYSDFS